MKLKMKMKRDNRIPNLCVSVLDVNGVLAQFHDIKFNYFE